MTKNGCCDEMTIFAVLSSLFHIQFGKAHYELNGTTDIIIIIIIIQDF